MTYSSKLASAGVISKLSIRQWSGRASDKQAGRETAARNSAVESMVRVYKTLVPQGALEPIHRLASEVRSYHYDHTVAWSEGAQFLPAKLSIPYSTAMQEFRLRFDTLAGEFCSQYSNLAKKAPALLGDLYRAGDYPRPSEIRQRFALDVSYEPVPEADHFFANLAATTLEEYQRDLEKKNQEREQQMRQDLWNRLHEPVLKMAEALAVPDKIFRDSLVANVRDIAHRMEDLNVLGDPHLADMAGILRRTLSTIDPNVLRTSTPDRSMAASSARQLAD